jgi:hypothetical protein
MNDIWEILAVLSGIERQLKAANLIALQQFQAAHDLITQGDNDNG